MSKEWTITLGGNSRYRPEEPLHESELPRGDAICNLAGLAMSASPDGRAEITVPSELGELTPEIIGHVQNYARLNGWRLLLAEDYFRKMIFQRLPIP